MIAAGPLRESIDNVESLCSTLGDDCGFRRMDCLRYTEKAENAADIPDRVGAEHYRVDAGFGKAHGGHRRGQPAADHCDGRTKSRRPTETGLLFCFAGT